MSPGLKTALLYPGEDLRELSWYFPNLLGQVSSHVASKLLNSDCVQLVMTIALTQSMAFQNAKDGMHPVTNDLNLTQKMACHEDHILR